MGGSCQFIIQIGFRMFLWFSHFFRISDFSLEGSNKVKTCYRRVLEVLKPMEGDRKCYRMVGTTLVEHQISTVIPILETTLKNVSWFLTLISFIRCISYLIRTARSFGYGYKSAINLILFHTVFTWHFFVGVKPSMVLVTEPFIKFFHTLKRSR